ncbi:MAG: hypothetical protein JJU29_05135 [Verrucomicrobia bacterium]|nr:hypothetical protein [Verrucomicrobiota bacterium]MCH8514039.1 hypothetical protein [Kiritimatiellia bacterium]
MKFILSLVTLLFSGMLMADEPTAVTVSLQTPHPGFGLEIERVVQKDGELHVLAKVIAPDPDMMYAMVISEVSDTVHVDAPAGKINAYVYNRTWSWDDDRVTALDNAADFNEKTDGGEAVKIKRPGKDK